MHTIYTQTHTRAHAYVYRHNKYNPYFDASSICQYARTKTPSIPTRAPKSHVNSTQRTDRTKKQPKKKKKMQQRQQRKKKTHSGHYCCRDSLYPSVCERMREKEQPSSRQQWMHNIYVWKKGWLRTFVCEDFFFPSLFWHQLANDWNWFSGSAAVNRVIRNDDQWAIGQLNERERKKNRWPITLYSSSLQLWIEGKFSDYFFFF